MVLWNLYFLSKLGLMLTGHLTPWVLANLGLLALVAAKHAVFKPRRFGLASYLLEFTVLVPLGLALALHELGLVVNAQLLQQIVNLTSFSSEYLWELTQRTVQPQVFWAALVALVVLRVANRYMRLSTWTAMALLATGVGQWQSQHASKPTEQVVQAPQGPTAREGDRAAERVALGEEGFAKLQSLLDNKAQSQATGNTPEQALRQFYQDQTQKLTPTWDKLRTGANFDILMLHICSVSWADIRYAKLSTHPLLTQADVVFNQFNTVSSYSGPASLRLLRGNCGQAQHKNLYETADPQCLTFSQLRQIGYQVELGLNHDGQFDRFKATLLNNLPDNAAEKVPHTTVATGVRAFDGSTAARDEDYLLAWWNKRISADDKPRAFYYNTITLHDGNTLPNSRLTSLQSYPERLERLMDDVQGLLRVIQKSDRRALVLIIPEHGAGLSGGYGQLPGLREIPTPDITLAPVLAYWIAPDAQRNPAYTYPVQVKQPTSYLAVAEFVQRWLKTPEPERLRPEWPLLVSDLPSTPFVAEQGITTVIEHQNAYWTKNQGGNWTPLKDK